MFQHIIFLSSFILLVSSALAQSSSSFPGRRIGGATRGPCPQYLLANMVPDSNAIRLSSNDYFGIIYTSSEPIASSLLVKINDLTTTKTFSFKPTSSQGILVFPLSSFRPSTYTVESSSVCPTGNGKSVVSPPATSNLLLQDRPYKSADSSIYSTITSSLSTQCNKVIPTSSLSSISSSSFDLAVLLSQPSVSVNCAIPVPT